MANADNIALVIRAIKGEASISAQEAIGFNMASFVCETKADLEDKSGRECRFIACVAGLAYLLATSNKPEAAIAAEPDDIEAIAADFIGIDEDEAAHLFYDLPDAYELKDVSTAAAIDTLKRLAVTGTVEWRLN